MENAVKAHAGNKLTDDVAGKNPQTPSPRWTGGGEKDKNRESRARHIGQHFNQTVLLYQALKCLPTLCIELSDGFVHSATDQRACAGWGRTEKRAKKRRNLARRSL